MFVEKGRSLKKSEFHTLLEVYSQQFTAILRPLSVPSCAFRVTETDAIDDFPRQTSAKPLSVEARPPLLGRKVDVFGGKDRNGPVFCLDPGIRISINA